MIYTKLLLLHLPFTTIIIGFKQYNQGNNIFPLNKKWEEKQTRQDYFIKQVQEQRCFYFKSFHPVALILFRWTAETALFSFWLSWSLFRSLLSPLNARNHFFLRKSTKMFFLDCSIAIAWSVKPTRCSIQ